MVRKLQVQVNHNYENSSLPASECIDRKKITNNREKTGKKLRARKGHPHHARKPLVPDMVVEIPPEEGEAACTRPRRRCSKGRSRPESGRCPPKLLNRIRKRDSEEPPSYSSCLISSCP